MIFLIIFLLVNIFEPETFFGSGIIWDLVSIVSLLAGCVYYLPLQYGRISYTPIINTRGFLLFTLFLLLLIISFWRTHNFLNTQFSFIKNSFTIALIPLFIYFLYQKKAVKTENFEKEFLKAVIHILGIFCFVNFIAFVLEPTYANVAATTFRFIGVSTKKMIFPLYPDTHPASIGSLGGFLVVLSAAYLKHVKARELKDKLLLISYIIIGLIIILMSDSRANLFTAVISVFGMYALFSFNKLSLIKYSVWLLPFSNLLFISVLQVTANTSFMSQISRSSSADIATGNSRAFIYMAANKELSDFKPEHIVGFGEYGPYGIGLTKYYMEDKFGYETKEQKLISSVTHNTALQVIFDIGYLGLVIYLLLLFAVFSQSITLFNKGKPAMILISYLLAYMVINGTSATYYGNYHPFQNYLFIILAFFVFMSSNARQIECKQDMIKSKPNDRS
jgi:hypothetical protein